MPATSYTSPRQPNNATPRTDDSSVQPQFLTWQLDETNDIINFSLTKCRTDILNRLKHNQLYTLEEAKILLKQILKVVTKQAEIDLKNLMFLSRYRTEKLYPKPIVANWLDPEGNITKIGGFHDSEEFMDIINRRYEGKPAPKVVGLTQGATYDESEMSGRADEQARGAGTHAHRDDSSSIMHDDGHSIEEHDSLAEEPQSHEDVDRGIGGTHQESPQKGSDDGTVSMTKSKEKLQSLVWRINQSLVKLIDSSLKQRRERLLLSATILEELESMPDLKKQLQDKYDYTLHASVASRQKQQSKRR
eukprot:CAMPEP_0117450062 /NCGR_PEP_ID=MMETSP0759-20121206/8271_1 /TAXON_ID=63605 /ORGANISM="Percolomonas cosmopolitus, Strain WS" /LENGTH=303 /DNA_ID=CAMNT_0005242565 /DNA_START=6 /DNA_END=917 /DNA_ORIENTATION=+